MKGEFSDMKTTVEVPKDTESSNKRVFKKPSKYVFLVLVLGLVVLVSGIVILAVYFGTKISRDNFQEYHTTIRAKDGQILNEKVTVSKTEERFETDEVIAIFDFSKGLSIYKFKDNKSKFDDCYVASFNVSDISDPEALRKDIGDETDFNVQQLPEKNYTVTDIWLNPTVLGQSSRETCKDRHIWFIKEGTENGSIARSKRRVEFELRVNLLIVSFRVKVAFGRK